MFGENSLFAMGIWCLLYFVHVQRCNYWENLLKAMEDGSEYRLARAYMIWVWINIPMPMEYGLQWTACRLNKPPFNDLIFFSLDHVVSQNQ